MKLACKINGANKEYTLTTTQPATPYLVLYSNGQCWYLALEAAGNGAIKIRIGNNTYSIKE